jgi:hypothetical protein
MTIKYVLKTRKVQFFMYSSVLLEIQYTLSQKISKFRY